MAGQIKEWTSKLISEKKLESFLILCSSLLLTGSIITTYNLQPGKTAQKSIIIQKNTTASSIIVDIAGAVKFPAVYELKSGQRLYELINKAGGLDEGADKDFFEKNLNRAQKLNDQQKIYIPFREEINISKDNPTAGQILISVNSATIAQLESLPGIGKVTAEKVIQQRPYSSLTELIDKKVLKTNVFQEIEHLITL